MCVSQRQVFELGPLHLELGVLPLGHPALAERLTLEKLAVKFKTRTGRVEKKCKIPHTPDTRRSHGQNVVVMCEFGKFRVRPVRVAVCR